MTADRKRLLEQENEKQRIERQLREKKEAE